MSFLIANYLKMYKHSTYLATVKRLLMQPRVLIGKVPVNNMSK